MLKKLTLSFIIMVFTLSVSSISNITNAQSIDPPGMEVECNTVNVTYSIFHTSQLTICSDGSGTEFHNYPFGLYCVVTWDGKGGRYKNCGTV